MNKDLTDPTLEPVSVQAGSTDRHEHILLKDQSKSDLGKKNIHESAVSKYGEGSTGSAQAGNGQEAGGSVAPQQNRPAGVEFVKTRFAPSPTGYMHVGGVRTALFAWLLARQKGGEFILRIEDTDKNREVDGSIEHIIKCLDWLGLDYDQGPIKQSDRLEIYKTWANKLIESGRAYVDPYTPEEVQAFREQAQEQKQPFLYRNHRPETLDITWDGTKPLRFKSDPKPYNWHDLVMGDMHSGEEVIDDFVLMKSDGYPTYNFAHIIDDHEMKISHIIRGQEFLASTPNYLNLYEALEVSAPIIASVPPIMNEQGNKKLSKRDGAKDLLEYRDEGYLPEAMINFLASLGWNDGTEQEVFSARELIEKFSLERIQRSGARFDERRLLWMNGAHIRQIWSDNPDKLYGLLSPSDDNPAKEGHTGFWPKEAYDPQYDQTYRMKVLGLVQERLKFFSELPELTNFFFYDLPNNPELISTHKQLKKLPPDELKNLLNLSLAELEKTEPWTVAEIQNTLNNLLERTGKKPAELFSLIRIATTQAPASPGLSETLELLGKEKSITRISEQLESL